MRCDHVVQGLSYAGKSDSINVVCGCGATERFAVWWDSLPNGWSCGDLRAFRAAVDAFLSIFARIDVQDDAQHQQFDPAVLRALLDAATPGPWSADAFKLKDDSDPFVQPLYICDGIKASQFAKDLALIVYLRNHAGELLDERERLQVERNDALAKVAELERLVDETHPSELNIEFEDAAPRCEPCQQFPRANTWAEKLKNTCPTAVQVASDYEEEVQELAKDLAASRQRASAMHRRAQRAEALLPWDDSRRTTTGRVAVALQAVALARTTDERDEARAEITRLKAELEDARDALDMARARLEDPEGTPLDEDEEFIINDNHGGYVPDVVLAICRGEIASNSAGDQLFDFDEPLDEAAEESL